MASVSSAVGADDRAPSALSEPQHAALCDSAVQKAYRRILPVLLLGYIVSYLDRTNVGFAALTMNRNLGLTPTQFGWGAGLFFVSYACCEVPSNFALRRFGARRWLGRIMITWGLLAAATAFVQGANSFYAFRFLLGAAEAGFFPGVVTYLSFWFPRAYRGRVLAWFTLGVPLSAIISGPLSGLFLDMDHVFGLAGWQWLLIVQGLPAAVLGVWIWMRLPDTPAEARWLSEPERIALNATLARENTFLPQRDFKAAMRDPRVWLLTLILFGILIGSIGMGLWLPQIIQRQGSSSLDTGLLSAVPYVFAAIGMVVWARYMDRNGGYVGTLVSACLLGALGFVTSTAVSSPTGALVGITVGLVGVNAARTAMWALPSTFLTGAAAVGGIAFINAVSNFAGLLGPAMVGTIRQQTGSFALALQAMALVLVGTAALALVFGAVTRRRATETEDFAR